MNITKSFLLFVGAGLMLAWPASVPAGNFTVTISNFVFTPTSLNIGQGDTVTWTNTTSILHTSTSGTVASGAEHPDSLWNSGAEGPNGTFTLTFDGFAPRTYPYYCQFHALSFGMIGSLTVTNGATPAPILSNPLLTNGQFHLTINGLIGQTNVLQVTPDFVNWSALSTNLALSTNFTVVDPFASNAPVGFYRVLQSR